MRRRHHTILALAILMASGPVPSGFASPYPELTALRAPEARSSGLPEGLSPLQTVEQGSSRTNPSAPEVPAGAEADWLAAVLEQIAASEYETSITPEGLQAPNRAQNLRTYFRTGRIEVVRRTDADPGWRFTWRTLGWGRESQLRDLAPVEPVAQGIEVHYIHEGFVEWYRNLVEGLEQGFTIESRPAGDGPLLIQGRIGSEPHGADLRPRLHPEDEAIDLVAAQTVVLRYAGLVVRDANGNELEAGLTLDGDRVQIRVVDHEAVYPVVVDPVVSSPSWTFEHEDFGLFYAHRVGAAGDVNADGYSDVIVSAFDFDGGITDQGKVFVHLGSPSGPPERASWVALGDYANANLGSSISTAGDVNGDGYDDIIVGAYRYTRTQLEEGLVAAWYGSPSGLGVDGTIANADWTYQSNVVGAHLGDAVGAAGDVDGDGYDDVVVGAATWGGGRALLFEGATNGLSPSAAWTMDSDRPNASFGVDVGTAGDVNGDGYDDVIVGAHHYTFGGVDWGSAFVWFGSPTGLSSGTPSTADWSATDGVVSSEYGLSVAGVGDVNGDGYADVMVGAPGYDVGGVDSGVAFLYPGTGAGPTVLPTWTWGPNQAGAQFGVSVATAGDVNGDGFADAIIGALGLDIGGVVDRGAAYVYQGSGTGLGSLQLLLGDPSGGTRFGQAVATAGDVDGNGYSDVIVGAPWDGNGKVFIYRGLAIAPELSASFAFASTQEFAEFGYAIAPAGDVNGDGYGDVIIGTRLQDNGQSDEGLVFVRFGSPGGLGGNWFAESNQNSAWFGSAVASAGDVNGDGYSDIIVGAPKYADGENAEGHVFIWFGGASGLGDFGNPTNADWIGQIDESFAELGTSVASAGDVNGDGVGDVIAGAPGSDGDRGEVVLFLGETGSGPSIDPAWRATTSVSGARLGGSVASAGDVNGDGFSDIIVGAPGYSDDDATEPDEGWAMVWLGGVGSLVGTETAEEADWWAQGDQAFAEFGHAVSTAGDMNGDGYSDVLIGAPFYDNGQMDEGMAFGWYGGPAGLGPNGSPGNAPWSTDGGVADGLFGYSVAAAGDPNGDGYSDVIVGQPEYDVGPLARAGRAILYIGSIGGTSTLPGWLAEGELANARFGWSVAGGGDWNGDGFSDLLVGSPWFNDATILRGGKVYGFYGNRGDGLDRFVQQRRQDNVAPIHVLGASDSETAMKLQAYGRTPAGRGKVRIEFEVKPQGVPFDGTDLGRSPAFLDTGAPVTGEGSALFLAAFATGLTEGTAYHWRARILTDSPFFPHSPWLSQPYGNRTEMSFRTPGGMIGVGDDATVVSPAAIRLGAPAPNPLTTRASFAYELVSPAWVGLSVHDVSGRRVAMLADGLQEPGIHTGSWDGRGSSGRKVAPGVYFLRLSVGTEIASRKLVVAH